MKYLLLIICGIGVHLGGIAQTMRASIGPGSSSDKVIIYIRPDAAVNGTISTLAFNIALPSSAPATTLSVTQTLLPGFVWTLGAPYTESGYRHYSLTTASSPTVTIAANAETAVMEVTFTGGGAGVSNAYLLTLPDGGLTDGNAVFFCSGAANSNGSDLYYTRTGPPATIVSNGFSYRHTPSGTGFSDGTDISFATMAATLPVTFISYDARCHEKGAIVTWSTASEQNSKTFEIQRSEDGTNWRTIGAVQAAGNSSNIRNYNYLDLQGGAALYRIRQTDLDGRSTFTAVKRTDCQSSDFNIVLYPVPTRDNLTVVIRSDKDIKTDLQIIDMKGSIIRRIPTQINKGNNTINLVVTELPAGQYMLRSADAAGIINKKFTVAR